MKAARERILDAAQALLMKPGKSLKSISVNEIIAEAGVSRQSFYRHFKDTGDLFFQVYHKIFFSRTDQLLNKTGSFFEADRMLLEQIKEQLPLCRELFRQSYYQNMFMSRFHKECMDGMLDILGRSQLTEELQVLVEMWQHGTEYLLAAWISDGAKEPVDTMIRLFFDSMPPELSELYSPLL